MRKLVLAVMISSIAVIITLVLSGCMLFTYSVSGYVTNASGNGIPGVLISFSDGLPSVKTNSQGYWSQSGLIGSVVITPSLNGYTFNPANQTVTQSNNNVDFTVASYSISGYITDPQGNGMSGVMISFSNGLPSVVTNSQGYWSQTILNSSVVVTPYLSGYTFTPTSISISYASTQVNFRVATYPLFGYVLNSEGVGMSGVNISFNNGLPSVTTNSNGSWYQTGFNGSVVITPSLSGYTFSPASTVVSYTSNSIIFKLATYPVSGYVQYPNGTGLGGVDISFGGIVPSVTTNQQGFWYQTGLRGTVLVTPISTGFTFNPVSMSVNDSNNTNINFVVASYPVSGYVTNSQGNGVSGVNISFSNGLPSVITNSQGYWSQSGLSGSVVITPSLSGYTFSPPNQTVTQASNNVDFIAQNIVPPNVPSNPTPYSGQTNVSTNVNLTWAGGGPNGDNITYNVYFGTTSNPPLVASGLTSTFYNPGILSYSTTYYWEIVSDDENTGLTSTGPVWSFTTSAQPAPVTYSVSGYVLNGSGTGVAGVILSFSDGLSSVMTNSQGYWAQSGLTGNVTITPHLNGYTFTPPSITVTVANNSVNFTGSENTSGSLSITNEWNLTTNSVDNAGQIYSSPVMTTNGFVAIGGNRALYIINSSSGFLYASSNGAAVWSSPVCDYNSNEIFVGNNAGQLIYTTYPFSNYNTLNVSYYQIIGAPLVLNGNVYVIDENGDIYMIPESTMTAQQIGTINGAIWASPVTNGQDIFIGSENGTFYAVNATTGNVDWSYPIDQKIFSTAAIGLNGNIYVAGNSLFSFTPSGQLRWSAQLDGSQVYGSPVISENGVIFIGTINGDFYAIDSSNGNILWEDNLSTSIGGISSTALIGNNGIVYVASGWILCALDPGTGALISEVGLGYNIESSPVLNGGYIYIGCDDGNLYQVQALSSTIDYYAGWPMFMNDWYHRGM